MTNTDIVVVVSPAWFFNRSICPVSSNSMSNAIVPCRSCRSAELVGIFGFKNLRYLPDPPPAGTQNHLSASGDRSHTVHVWPHVRDLNVKTHSHYLSRTVALKLNKMAAFVIECVPHPIQNAIEFKLNLMSNGASWVLESGAELEQEAGAMHS